jgi:hypothetical protein
MQKHCQSLYAMHNYTQSGCHQSRLLYLFSDITRKTQSVFDTSPSAHPLTTSNSASSLVQLSFAALRWIFYILLFCFLVCGEMVEQYSRFELTKDLCVMHAQHPLTTSKSASSLIQLSFGMHYHLILSLLLLWISLNHRSKLTTTKQFSIIYVNRLLF